MSKVGEYLEKIKNGVGSFEASKDEFVRRAYFLYLCDMLEGSERYHILLRKLYNKEFYWSVPHDENRAVDGKCLRDEFAESTNFADYSAIDGPCNMLEMMIALAKRMADLTYPGEFLDETSRYFWEILGNLLGGSSRKVVGIDLGAATDDKIDPILIDLVDEKLDILLERKFFKNGNLGLYPTFFQGVNQTKIEIWSQMQNYLLKKG